jgi:hypothetical protein
MIDDQHSLAQPLDIAHVVRGQQQRGSVSLPLADEELPQPFLADHV